MVASSDDDSAKILRPTKARKKAPRGPAPGELNVSNVASVVPDMSYERREEHGPEMASLTSTRSKTGFTRRSKSRSRGEIAEKGRERKKEVK